jgi:hypothetical protein
VGGTFRYRLETCYVFCVRFASCVADVAGRLLAGMSENTVSPSIPENFANSPHAIRLGGRRAVSYHGRRRPLPDGPRRMLKIKIEKVPTFANYLGM